MKVTLGSLRNDHVKWKVETRFVDIYDEHDHMISTMSGLEDCPEPEVYIPIDRRNVRVGNFLGKSLEIRFAQT